MKREEYQGSRIASNGEVAAVQRKGPERGEDAASGEKH